MRIATDIGGTFTDLVYVDHNGEFGFEKAHTTPPYYENGVINVISQSRLDASAVETFIHGTTIIINSLTERKGVKTGLITTKGFKDILEIARGNRPDLYNIRYRKPAPFVERHLRKEMTERVNYKGEILTPVKLDMLEDIIAEFKAEGVEAIAICYLHAYVNPIHEIKTAQAIAKLWPDVSLTCSHEVTKEWREYERTNTSVLNSYVKPIAVKYVNQLSIKLAQQKLNGQKFIMQSNGGTTSFEQAKKNPINLVESGPVAGILGASVLGKLLGEKNIIAFDIGGTTAKCSLISQNEVKVTTDYYIEKSEKSAGYPIKVPVVDIVEIGNGGGSIAHFNENGSLQVGPKSAGSSPGPIAYGKGGVEPTTTDANLVTGRLSINNFDTETTIADIQKLMFNKISQQYSLSPEETALGIIRLANSNMLNALKLISVRKGYDPRDFSLIAFGGGGPLHAASLAQELGVSKVIVPVASSVFSAWGMLMSDLRYDFIKTQVKRVYSNNLPEFNNQWNELENEALAKLKKDEINKEKILFNRMVDMRYFGQEHTVKINVPSTKWDQNTVEDIISLFHQSHEQAFTFRLEEAEVEIVNMHLVAFGEVEKPALKKLAKQSTTKKEAVKEVRNVYYEDHGWTTTYIYDRSKLAAGFKIDGPLIVEEPSASTVINPGQRLIVDEYGNLHIYLTKMDDSK